MDQGYLQKGYGTETTPIIVEKRIETIQEFHIASIKLKDCVSKFTPLSTTRKAGDTPIYIKSYCEHELTALWNAGYKANVYYTKKDSVVGKELQNLNTTIDMYLFKSALSPFRTDSYIKSMNESLDKTEQLMQEHIYVF